MFYDVNQLNISSSYSQKYYWTSITCLNTWQVPVPALKGAKGKKTESEKKEPTKLDEDAQRKIDVFPA